MSAIQEQVPTQDFDEVFSELNELMPERGRSLAVMESCTGGFISHAVTNLPGCGAYFLGGIVSYATEGKIALGVDKDLIEKFGVISGETAEAMARTVREQFGASYGLGITGVAGPKTQEGKPIGTIYVAVAGAAMIRVRRFVLGDNGLERNKQLAAKAAVALLVDSIRQLEGAPIR